MQSSLADPKRVPMTILTISAATFCAVCILLHCTSILAVVARHGKPSRSAGWLQRDEGVSIVRPVCGVENFSATTLGSAFHLDYPNYEILFCAAHAGDPVLPLVRRLIAAHPGVPARILVGNDPISTNPKLNNAVKGWQASRELECTFLNSYQARWQCFADSIGMGPSSGRRDPRARWLRAGERRCCGAGKPSNAILGLSWRTAMC
jgi:hypothetical protein